MASNYNCIGNENNAYGAGDFGLCNGKTVGAPNTGLFWQSVDSAGFTIIAPLVGVILVVVIASIITKFRKKSKPSELSDS